MTAREYATMFQSLPTENGLTVIGHAFLQECIEGARPLRSSDEVREYSQQQQAKWLEFCDIVDDTPGVAPNREAFTALPDILLSRKGLRF
jgi:hypothetical protein